MIRQWNGICLWSEDESLFPSDAYPASALFSPLVFLVCRDGRLSRGIYAVTDLNEVWEEESVALLAPLREKAEGELAEFVLANGATVLNTVFAGAFEMLLRFLHPKKEGFRVTLVGLGDVGGTVLTGLKLLGHELACIAVYDPNEALCQRYEMELNQVLQERSDLPLPRVTVCREEDLFACDMLLFTASRGVPGLDSGVTDVRMAQFAANRAMLEAYARKARAAEFRGLFCQISDPVDQLAREVFLCSNRNDEGEYDFAGLLPEQVQGFGLGVMAGRAAYYAEKVGVDFSAGRVYGPHGRGLIVANCVDEGYDDEVSRRLTELTGTANLAVRELGFKPYIAPGLSSAAISVLRLLRGREHYGAMPINGAYFGCISQMTRQGPLLCREKMCRKLYDRLEETHRALRAFDAQ